MLTAYKRNLLDNYLLVDEAEDLYETGFISKDKFQQIRSNLPALVRSRNIFMWLMLLVFGIFMLSACFSFIGLFFMEAGVRMGNSFSQFLIFIFAAISFFALEFVIRWKNFFGNGVDDAFLLCGMGLIIILVLYIFGWEEIMPACLTAIVIGSICAYRYIDSKAAIVALTGFSCFIIDIALKAGPWGKMLLPFIVMIVAGGIYALYLFISANPLADKYWNNVLKTIYVFSLVLFYLSGNYMVVREASDALLGNPVTPGNDIAFAWIFYVFTISIPLLYIYRGLLFKERLILRTGMLALAFGIYAVKYYHHILPLEWGLVLAGAALLAISYFGIRKLKSKTNGLTFEPDRLANKEDILDVEAIAILEDSTLQPVRPSAQDHFGGGESGGGGSSGNY